MLNTSQSATDPAQGRNDSENDETNTYAQPGEGNDGGLNPESLGPSEVGIGQSGTVDPAVGRSQGGGSGESNSAIDGEGSGGDENSAANDLAEHDDLTADGGAAEEESEEGDETANGGDDELQAFTPSDAIDLLTADHARVKALFEQFESRREDDRQGIEDLVAEICLELTIHTQIEEEIFYPGIRDQIEDDDLMDEALVEHAGAKNLISDLLDMSSDEAFYDAKVTVLRESIEHHVEEEETDMFPKVRNAGVDTETLGQRMAERKMEFVRRLIERN